MSPTQAAYRAVIARRSLPHGQRPTDLHIRLMWLLARWQHATPSHSKLARAAHCHRNTVGNALRRLRALGVLDWSPRFVRLAGHVARASNTYRFLSNPLPTGHERKQREKREKTPSFLARQSLCTGNSAADLAALAARRAVIEGRMRSAGRVGSETA